MNFVIKKPYFRFLTTVNVMGDAIGAGVIHCISKKDLEKMEPHPDKENNIEPSEV